MRYICVILTVLILSSASKSQTSPNMPGQIPAATLPASPNTPPVVQTSVQQPTTAPTTTITQQTTSHSDETVRAERDAYKQVVEAYQKSLETIKWAIGIILAMFGYVIFRSTREYKEAVSDAKKACEKAEEWEEKARAAFEKIDARVENKLKEIDEQVKIELEQIEKQGKESIKEIDDKGEKERRISELWNTALRLYNEGKYDEACDKYVKIIELSPNDYWPYIMWGNATAQLAELKGDEILFAQALRKYEQAINIKPNKPEAYKGLTVTLLYMAQRKIGTPEHQDLLRQAEEMGLKAESLKKGEGAYNLACVYARKGDKEQCKKWLLAGQEAGTLEPRDHAMKDKDLESVRNEAWFKEIKWKGEK